MITGLQLAPLNTLRTNSPLPLPILDLAFFLNQAWLQQKSNQTRVLRLLVLLLKAFIIRRTTFSSMYIEFFKKM